jgi:hypothetical protein
MSPPDDAVVWIVDINSHPCEKNKPEAAFMWTWEGAKQWHYASLHKPPAIIAARRKANSRAIWTGRQWRYDGMTMLAITPDGKGAEVRTATPATQGFKLSEE